MNNTSPLRLAARRLARLAAYSTTIPNVLSNHPFFVSSLPSQRLFRSSPKPTQMQTPPNSMANYQAYQNQQQLFNSVGGKF